VRVAAFCGYSGSGKTTAAEAAIRELVRRGLRVASVKSVHAPVLLDVPGKDTWRHAEAGAEPVVAVAREGMAIVLRRPWSLLELSRRLDADLLVVEGLKRLPLPNVVCARNAGEAVELAGPRTFAVSGPIADASEELPGLPVLVRTHDGPRLAELILGHAAELEAGWDG